MTLDVIRTQRFLRLGDVLTLEEEGRVRGWMGTVPFLSEDPYPPLSEVLKKLRYDLLAGIGDDPFLGSAFEKLVFYGSETDLRLENFVPSSPPTMGRRMRRGAPKFLDLPSPDFVFAFGTLLRPASVDDLLREEVWLVFQDGSLGCLSLRGFTLSNFRIGFSPRESVNLEVRCEKVQSPLELREKLWTIGLPNLAKLSQGSAKLFQGSPVDMGFQITSFLSSPDRDFLGETYLDRDRLRIRLSRLGFDNSLVEELSPWTLGPNGPVLRYRLPPSAPLGDAMLITRDVSKTSPGRWKV